MTNHARTARRLDAPQRFPDGGAGQSITEFALLLPIILILFVAVADFARLYTTMTTVESAAREAADYGAFDSQYWTNPAAVRAQMIHRACLAASDLPDYVGTKDDTAATCTNPEVLYADLVPQSNTDCTNPDNPDPCWVRVTLEYDFRLILPLNIRMFDVELGFPTTVTFQRTSTFAITDLQLESQSPPPPTTPEPTPVITPEPSIEPSVEPSVAPSLEPSPEITPAPEPEPTPGPTPDPNATPSPEPSPSEPTP